MMCVVSMVSEHYRDKWRPMYPEPAPFAPPYTHTVTWPIVTREEFDRLKRDVENMKALLIKAKLYDEANGEPDCEMDEKVAFIRKIADAVGVDLEEVFGP